MSEYIRNSEKRQAALKSVIRQLHDGRSVDEVKSEFAALLKDVGAAEIAALEQALIDEGLPEMEVKRLCDVHVAVFRESLDAQAAPESIPGHPVHTFRAENVAVGRVLDGLDAAIRAGEWQAARAGLQELREYDKHYLRKEHILFPYLEKHGFAGPSSVMWAIHDDVRAGWKRLAELLGGDPDPAQVAEVFGPLATAIREMVFKEENILFPTSLQKLSDDEWRAIRAQEAEVGYCYIQPGDLWPEGVLPVHVAAPVEAQAVLPEAAERMIPLKTGALTPQQINLLLNHLPVEISFVDENDTVRYFSQAEERIFQRSPAIIGRRVQKCHPPASLARVQRILDDFRSGARDEAEFWLQMQGRFVHIRYFAMRDEGGAYRGALEVVQDVTAIRALESERRLLDE